MKVLALLVACLCAVQAAYVPTHTADPSFLVKQKNIYELFWHIDQPTVYHPELYAKARSFSIEDHIDSYTDRTAVTEFLQRVKYGLLPRGSIFTIVYHHLHEELVSLFRVFYTAKDFDTFYNTAVWARFNVNEHMFVYALACAVLHRPDCKHIQMPPLYEVLPHYFFNDDVLHHAYHIGHGDSVSYPGVKKTVGGVDHHIIYSNYSGWYLVRHDVSEQKLNYFTEDVGLNSYYFFYNHDFPAWMNSVQYNLPQNIRGEMYFYGHKQLLVRYYLERLSNDMDQIEFVDWHSPIHTGYYPTMHFINGLPFPQRETGAKVPLESQFYVQLVQELENRIANVVDSGYIQDANGKHVNIYTPEGLNLLGNIVQGNADAHNQMFYGHYDALCRRILGFGLPPATKYQLAPSALEVFSTSIRDPVFFSMYKRIINYFLRYKAHLPTYTHEELVFPGVKVESVSVDKLMTYFDYFESMLNNAVSVHSHKEAQSTIIKARQYRLNHKPFTYHITVTSDKNINAMVRVFLGPKYDEHGHELDISENYHNFLELDQWVVELKNGVNKIERHSHESIYVVPDQVPSEVMYKKILKAIDGTETFTYGNQIYGFPDRLLLPKGKREGMPFKVFVHVAPFEEQKSFKFESPVWGQSVIDGRSQGFPLDRPMHAYNFTVSNMMFKDVMIFHKQMEELNVTV